MISMPEKIYFIRLHDNKSPGSGKVEDDMSFMVRLSHDKTKIICLLYKQDTVEIMADKLLKAQSLMDELLEYNRYKKESPDLSEALYYNIPEFQEDRVF